MRQCIYHWVRHSAEWMLHGQFLEEVEQSPENNLDANAEKETLLSIPIHRGTRFLTVMWEDKCKTCFIAKSVFSKTNQMYVFVHNKKDDDNFHYWYPLSDVPYCNDIAFALSLHNEPNHHYNITYTDTTFANAISKTYDPSSLESFYDDFEMEMDEQKLFSVAIANATSMSKDVCTILSQYLTHIFPIYNNYDVSTIRKNQPRQIKIKCFPDFIRRKRNALNDTYMQSPF